MPLQQEQPSQQQPPAQPPPRSSPATLVLGGAAACVALITAATAPFLAPGLLRSFGVPFNPDRVDVARGGEWEREGGWAAARALVCGRVSLYTRDRIHTLGSHFTWPLAVAMR